VVVVAVLASLLVSRQVSRPLERLAREAQDVGRLHFESREIAHSLVREVDALAAAMEHMKGGLRSFQKYVPIDLVQLLIASGREADLGGEKREVTILFSDIADFTSIAEESTPEELVELLREYLTLLSKEIAKAGGTVDKYIGDAVMAFWGAPTANPQHAAAACIAATACQSAVQRLNDVWVKSGKRPFLTRIGVHTGEVVVGNIGSNDRLNYTVIGDPVNLASRLEGLNKVFGTQTLISETTYVLAKEAVAARPLDYVAVKGKRNPVLVYELLGLRSDPDSAREALIEAYRQALEYYRQQDWANAAGWFEEALRLRPDDPPSLVLRSRCKAFEINPPGPDWISLQ
jgi:adenylate cyclase